MRESGSKGEEIILSGYGLGGIVAKQVCTSLRTWRKWISNTTSGDTVAL